MAFPLSYRMHDDVCMVYLPIHLVESYGKMSKNIPVPWIRFRVFPKRHQARSPPPKKKQNGFETPKDILPSGPCLGWQTHTLPSRLHHDLTKGLRSLGVSGAVGFCGGLKKENKWKTRVDLNKQHQFTWNNYRCILYTYHYISTVCRFNPTIYIYANMNVSSILHQLSTHQQILTKIANYPWWRSYCTNWDA